ncbi:hypothetical protein LCGC14_2750950, partial [marine sediment metagenome]
MKNNILICYIFILFICSLSCSQAKINVQWLPNDFQKDAFKHVEYLANLGTRDAGSVTEKKAITYIQKELEEAGLIVAVESFEIAGRMKDKISSNIVASIKPMSNINKEIIISAHLDSYGGPGANDNGSGIGVLIELAKYFANSKSELPYNLKFVAFGAEELGLLGSRAYIKKHQENLHECKLLFNMDCVGGNKNILIDMRDGIKNIPKQNGKWRLDKSAKLTASNVPEWLSDTILSVCKNLGYKITQISGQGSDHQSFALSGIVATSIVISRNKYSDAEDTPDKVHPESLQKAGNIVANVVLEVM